MRLLILVLFCVGLLPFTMAAEENGSFSRTISQTDEALGRIATAAVAFTAPDADFTPGSTNAGKPKRKQKTRVDSRNLSNGAKVGRVRGPDMRNRINSGEAVGRVRASAQQGKVVDLPPKSKPTTGRGAAGVAKTVDNPPPKKRIPKAKSPTVDDTSVAKAVGKKRKVPELEDDSSSVSPAKKKASTPSPSHPKDTAQGGKPTRVRDRSARVQTARVQTARPN
jgi:hypothetical protein